MISKFSKLLFACGLVIAVASSGNAADVVNRKSDEPAAQGTISAVSKTSVTVDRRIGGSVSVPANDIRSIQWEDEPAVLNLARNHEAAGRFDRALETYRQVATEVEADKENLKTDLEYLTARATVKQAMADPQQLAEAVKLLEAFLLKHSDSYNYYDAVMLLGQAYLEQDDFTKAGEQFEKLEGAPWNDYQMAARIAKARLMLVQDNLLGAQSAFDAVLAAEAKTPAELARRYEALLGKATGLVKQEEYDEAISVLQEVVQQVPPDETRIQAEAYVRQGDCLVALGRNKEAVLAYLHVDVLFPGESSLRAESLYHLARLWGVVGHADRGTAARESLVRTFPNSEWTKKLDGAAGN